jgi:hypothetical protein
MLYRAARYGLRQYMVDEFDWLVVDAVRDDRLAAMLVMPASELHSHGFIGDESSTKFSFSAYPPWSTPRKRSVIASKAWQAKYMFCCRDGEMSDDDCVRLRGLIQSQSYRTHGPVIARD